MFDLLIQNATIYDGTGAAPFSADVAVKDGKIAKIGENLSGGKTVINAQGLALSPGWIDSHSHNDRDIFKFPHQKEKLEQGVTFAIGGQCGGSIAPARRADGTIRTVEDLYRETENIPQGVYTALLVGFNTLRIAVMGSENRAPQPQELEQMKQMVDDAMSSGAIGMSLGLFYVPGCYASTEEVVEVAKVVAKHNGVLASHIRNESDNLIESVAEFLDILKRSGCRGVISHHKAIEHSNWDKVKTTLAMVDEFNAQGGEVYMDVYPYSASSTSILARFLPEKFHPPGTKNVLKLLEDPQIREKAKQWGIARWGKDLSWTLVVSCPEHPEYVGKDMSQIARMRGQEDQYEAVFDMLLEAKSRCNGCFFLLSEENVVRVLQHPHSMVGTDGSVAEGIAYHPRLRGSFPRALGRYAREQKIMPMEQMIYKMTGLPAHVYDLPGKGRIAEGYDADLCIFDPNTIRDQADYVNYDLPNVGLVYVIVNGKIAVENNTFNGTCAAKVYHR